MYLKYSFKTIIYSVLAVFVISNEGHADLSLDRTRIILNSNDSVALSVTNDNQNTPYLAQAWIENESGKDVSNQLAVFPLLQRIDPGQTKKIGIQLITDGRSIPQNRESLYYFNLREIPPKNRLSSSVQVAQQIRIKLFYRPLGLILQPDSPTFIDKLILQPQGNQLILQNPTPYHIVIIQVKARGGKNLTQFQPITVAPFGAEAIGVPRSSLGQSPILTYVNDYGAQQALQFHCQQHGACKFTATD